MSGPFKIEQYQPNSFVIVENKKNADHFYIILKGKLKVQKENEVEGDESNPILGPGDFFGVISAMSNHARIESVIAITPVVLILVYRDQFGLLIQKNAPVAMKIIRYFAKKLRLFDQTITRLTFKNFKEEDPSELYEIGEYYFRQQQYNHASFAYQAYLAHVPAGDKVSEVKMRLQAMNAPFQLPKVNYSSFQRGYKSDNIIFCEHEPGRELFILQKGKVKITKIMEENEVLLAVLEPGDIFGEMALLDGKPRSATAIAASEVQMMAINKANFEAMVQAQPQLASKLITILSERIWTAYRQLNNLMIADDLGRVYDTLLTLVEKHRIKISPKATHNFEIGTKDLLKMVGIPEEEGDHIIMDLLDEKLIKLEGGRIICMDLQELEKRVSYYKKKTLMDKKREKSRAM
jgi:CRP/FNR family transcriptional regulator